MALITVRDIKREIEMLGESVTVQACSSTYNNYGDETVSVTSSSSEVAIVTYASQLEEMQKSGIVRPTDLVFRFAGDVSNLSVGNRIVYDSNTYEIYNVLPYRVEGTTVLFEVFARRI